MEPGAKLTLNLRKQPEPQLDGWWLVDGVYMTDGIGILVVARPDVATKMVTDVAFAPDSLRIAAAILAIVRELTPNGTLLN